MAVIRVHKTEDYTVMSNLHFREKNMSLQAIGLLSLMLSLPDTWDYSIAGLCAIRKEKEAAIKNTLNELKQFGYLTVTKKLPNETESGRIEYEYDIYEKPQSQKQAVKKQAVEEQGVEEQGVEKQAVENHVQVNTKEVNTKEVNTKKVSTYNKSAAEVSKSREEQFNRFWDCYPRKVSKGQALKVWQKINPDKKLTDRIIEAVETAKKRDDRFREEKYTPHPATWLNGMEWENQYGQEVKESGEFHRSEEFRSTLPDYLINR